MLSVIRFADVLYWQHADGHHDHLTHSSSANQAETRSIFLFGGLPCLLNDANKPDIETPLVGREGLLCLGIRRLHPGFALGCQWLYLCKFSKVRFFSFPFQLSQLQRDGVRLSLAHREIHSMKPGSRGRCRKTRLFKEVGRDGGVFSPLHHFLPGGINVTHVLSLSW